LNVDVTVMPCPLVVNFSFSMATSCCSIHSSLWWYWEAKKIWDHFVQGSLQWSCWNQGDPPSVNFLCNWYLVSLSFFSEAFGLRD
jgi:hypothetical protein